MTSNNNSFIVDGSDGRIFMNDDGGISSLPVPETTWAVFALQMKLSSP